MTSEIAHVACLQYFRGNLKGRTWRSQKDQKGRGWKVNVCIDSHKCSCISAHRDSQAYKKKRFYYHATVVEGGPASRNSLDILQEC